MRYIIQTCDQNFVICAPSIMAACNAVQARFPGGQWSRVGTREYREIEREYVIDDDCIFVSTLDGIKSSVVESAARWENHS